MTTVKIIRASSSTVGNIWLERLIRGVVLCKLKVFLELKVSK